MFGDHYLAHHLVYCPRLFSPQAESPLRAESHLTHLSALKSLSGSCYSHGAQSMFDG